MNTVPFCAFFGFCGIAVLRRVDFHKFMEGVHLFFYALSGICEGRILSLAEATFRKLIEVYFLNILTRGIIKTQLRIKVLDVYEDS